MTDESTQIQLQPADETIETQYIQPNWLASARFSTILKTATSPHVKRPSMLSWFKPLAHPPEVVLEHDIIPGRCWSMKGSTGQIGVLFGSGRINVTAAFVEQPFLAPNDDIEASPKDFVVWGIVKKNEHVETTQRQEGRLSGQSTGCEDMASGMTTPPYVPIGYTTIKLSQGTYDPYNRTTQQLVKTPDNITSDGIRMLGIIFKISSNWGNPQHTCIYRIGAHGDRPTN